MGLDPSAVAAALGIKLPAAAANGRRRASLRAQAGGASAEGEIIAANRLYRVRRVAQVDKIPTATVRHAAHRGLRPGTFIASYAALDHRDGAPVDFVGHAIVAGQLVPVRIEVKSSSGANLPLARRPGSPTLAPHQRNDLALALAMGAVAGVLVRTARKPRGRPATRHWFWIPMGAWVDAVDAADASGQASLHAADIERVGIECASLPGGAPDWLAAVEEARRGR